MDCYGIGIIALCAVIVVKLICETILNYKRKEK